jgi:hypothetical protein
MKKLLSLLALALVFAFAAAPAQAVVNAPVNIAYPIMHNAYDNYVTFAFSVTCPGGQNTVKWGFDSGPTFGGSTYYDNFNAQLLHKLPTGWHTFDVYTDCGTDQVKFFVN